MEPTAVELTEKRTRNAKHFRLEDGRFQAYINPGAIHYQALPDGPFLEKRQNLKATDKINGYISDESDVVMETYEVGKGGARRWWVEFKEKLTGMGIGFELAYLPSPVTGTGELRFDSPEGGWSYYHTLDGGKMLGPPIPSSQGSKTYTFRYALLNGAPELVPNADGSVSCENLFTMAAPFLQGADGVEYAKASWQIDPVAKTLTFSYSDVELPASAYPYKVDPSTTFQISTGANDAVVYRAHTSYPPSSGTLTRSTSNNYAERSWNSTNDYLTVVGLWRFDTSSIDDNANIDSAYFRAYATGKSDANGLSQVADYHPWDGTSASDWTNDAFTTAHAGTVIANIASSGDRDYALQNLQNINKTGMTSLRWMTTKRANDAAPTGSNYITWITSETLSGNPPCRLIVNYTLDVTPPDPPANFSVTKEAA